jgi:hypothetical protein
MLPRMRPIIVVILRNANAAICILVTIAFGCARTNLTSRINPETNSKHFTRILVHGNFPSLAHRQAAEDRLCSKIRQAAPSCECVKALDTFFPGQEYSVDDIATRLTDLQIDGVLVIQPTGSGATTTYVPQSSYTTGTATVHGNTVSGSSTTQTYGGYDVSKPWANYEATLYSTSDGKVAWYATAESTGNAFADWSDLINSVCGKTVNKLTADGLVR